MGLVTAGTLSSLLELLTFTLVLNIATSIVLWLLLDRLPQSEVKDEDTPLKTRSTWLPYRVPRSRRTKND